MITKVILIVAVLIAGGYFAYTQFGSKPTPPAPAPAPKKQRRNYYRKNANKGTKQGTSAGTGSKNYYNKPQK